MKRWWGIVRSKTNGLGVARRLAIVDLYGVPLGDSGRPPRRDPISAT